MEWTRQVGAQGRPDTNNVHGMACAVTNDGKDVYLVGGIDKDASLSKTNETSAGGTDIFVMLLDSYNAGGHKVIRQIGSPSDDYIMDVATDSTGNALLYGTTTGSLYRYNTALEQDIFLLSVARVDGAFNPPINVDEDDMPSISPTTLTSQVPTMATSDTLNSESPSLDDTTIESSGMPSSVSSVDSSEVPTQMSSTVTGTVSMGSSENRTSGSGDKRGHNIATVFLSLVSLFLA